MSPEELEALNYKYPTCSTCQSRGVRTHKVSKRQTAQTTWCELHNRPVAYEYFAGPKGKKWVATDISCDQYIYRPAVFIYPNPVETQTVWLYYLKND